MMIDELTLDRKLRTVRNKIPGPFTIMACIFGGLWAYTISVLIVCFFLMRSCADAVNSGLHQMTEAMEKEQREREAEAQRKFLEQLQHQADPGAAPAAATPPEQK